jgi:colicin import membrane protein
MSEEQKESSVLFSLNELFSLEQDRIKQEEDEKRRRAEAAARAEEEARRRAIEEEQARLRAEEERKRSEEQRRREEAARLDALRQGEIEKARVSAEEQARLEAMRQQQAHAMELAKLSQDKSKKNLTIGIAVAVAAMLIGGSTGGILWYRSYQRSEEEKRAIAIENERKAQEMAQLKKQLEDQDKNVTGLLEKLAAAEDDATKAKLRAELASARKEREATAGALNRGGSGKKPSGPRPACTCVEGDPMCSCL